MFIVLAPILILLVTLIIWSIASLFYIYKNCYHTKGWLSIIPFANDYIIGDKTFGKPYGGLFGLLVASLQFITMFTENTTIILVATLVIMIVFRYFMDRKLTKSVLIILANMLIPLVGVIALASNVKHRIAKGETFDL